MRKIVLCVSLLIMPFYYTEAASNYLGGEITNVTATTAGLMIMLDSGMPGNCDGSPFGWMLIKKEHTVISSLVLAAWASGRKVGTIYTAGRENGNGYCLITQFDPEH